MTDPKGNGVFCFPETFTVPDAKLRGLAWSSRPETKLAVSRGAS